MKRWMLAGLLTTGLAQAAESYEGFNYVTETNLNNINGTSDANYVAGSSGGTGWTAGWGGGAGDAAKRLIEDGSLNYPGITSTGNKLFTDSSRIIRKLATPLGSGTHYFRVLLQQTNENPGYFGLALMDTSNNEKTLIGKTSNYPNWTINRVSSGVFTENDEGVLTENTVVMSDVPASTLSLLVAKLELREPSDENPQGFEQITFWVNPDLSKPERVSNAVGGRSYTTTLDHGSIGRIRVGTGGSATTAGAAGYTDEVAISSTSFFPAGPEIIIAQDDGDVLSTNGVTEIGDVLLNKPTTVTYTIRNDGNADLTDLAIKLTEETETKHFSVSALEKATLAPGESTSVTVTFKPTTLGLHPAVLEINSNDAYFGEFYLALNGVGVSPELKVEQPEGTALASASIVDFGGLVTLEDAAVERTITLRNTGTAPLLDLAVELNEGTNFSVSTLASNVVAVGESTTFKVTFAPTTFGEHTGTLSITSSDSANSPFTLALKGQAGVPQLVVKAPADTALVNGSARIDFGSSYVGTAPLQRTLTLSNEGPITLTGLAVALTGVADFQVSPLSVTTIAPGAATTLTVTFAANGINSRSANLVITSNDPANGSFGVALSAMAFNTSVATPGTENSFESTDIVWADVAAGAYDGLLYEGDKLVGALESFKVAKPKANSGKGGSFSAKLKLNGKSASIKGAFNTDGLISVSLPQKGKGSTPVVLNLQLQRADNPGASEVVSGTVTWNGITASAELLKAPFSSKNKVPEAWRGTFTMLVPQGADRSTSKPGGDSYARVSVSSSGSVKVTGAFGDGSSWTESGLLSANGEFSLYRELYRTTPKGLAGGRMTFRNIEGVSDFDGRIQWTKRADAREKRYPAGFSVEAAAIGSRFVAPAKRGYIVEDLASKPSSMLSFWVALGLSAPVEFEREVTWTNKYTWKHMGTEKLSGTISRTTGVFSGTYRNPLDNKKLTVKGIVFQKQGLVGGYILTTTSSGLLRVQLNAADDEVP